MAHLKNDILCKECNKKINNQYFKGVNGYICSECLKKNGVYYGLKKINLIKSSEDLTK